MENAGLLVIVGAAVIFGFAMLSDGQRRAFLLAGWILLVAAIALELVPGLL
jgi:hypothetical protein